MIHYTLNTGHSVESPRSGVAESVIKDMASLARNGGSLPPPFAAFRVEVTHAPGGAVFTIWRARDPLVTCGMAWTTVAADEVWPVLEKLYLDLGDRPDFVAPGAMALCPCWVPWLAVVLLPGLMATARQDVSWLGDFERCFAWAIMAQESA